jgi:hypothetical protein
MKKQVDGNKLEFSEKFFKHFIKMPATLEQATEHLTTDPEIKG